VHTEPGAGLARDPRWLLNRLRCMSPAEVLHRATSALKDRGARLRARWQGEAFGAAPPPDLAALMRPAAPWLAAGAAARDSAFGDERAALAEAARGILQGHYRWFGRRYALSFPPPWNRCPETGREAPLTWGTALDYRHTALVGNIKALWEPSRHAELLTLAQAYALSGDGRLARACGRLVQSWVEQCPYRLGVHWASALEVAIRLLHWAAAWQLLGGARATLFMGSAGRRLRSLWLASVWQHQQFLAAHLSRHSSANNHLLGEYLGLLAASLTWPCWKASARWRARAQAGFEAEVLRQNTPDGVNREQALWYHHEVADMMRIARSLLKAHGLSFGAEFEQREQAMLDFILALMDRGGHLPALGDSDDAHYLPLGLPPGQPSGVQAAPLASIPGTAPLPTPAAAVGLDASPFRSLLAHGALTFGRGDFKAAAGALDAKTRWLLGPDALERWAALPEAPARPARRIFGQGGYVLLGSRFGEPGEVRLVADSGPLGYLSLAAHGHADALAFTLSVGGQPLLIDPGTYCYHTEPEWRDWFRSTAAHNTVEIDGQSQSEMGGPFLWLRRANARLEGLALGEAVDVWEASHDGYADGPHPLIHHRRIELEHASGVLRVIDSFEAPVGRSSSALAARGSPLDAGREAVWHWHFGPAWQWEREDGGSWQGQSAQGVARVRVQLPEADGEPAARWLLGKLGSPSPGPGWLSSRLGDKQPCHCLQWRARVQAGRVFETRFKLSPRWAG
jgi:hypothetical protein